jgi:hypothetical protein
VDGSGQLLALGTGTNSSWLNIHLQNQVKGQGRMLAVFSGLWENEARGALRSRKA